MTVSRNALLGQPQSIPEIVWRGVSGTTYQMQAHPIGTPHRQVGAVYIFCRQTTPGQWQALYIGEAEDCDARIGRGLGQHHKWAAISRAGATHVCSRIVIGGKAERLAVETDPRHHHKPPLNDQ